MPNDVTSINHHPSTKKLFDYGKLDPSVAREAKAVATDIRARNQAFVIETGRDLYRVKQRLGHGLFSRWLHAEFSMTARTAQKYMNVAAVFEGKYEPSSHLPVSVLYDVASPSFPADTREDVLQRLQPGERPDVPALVDMVKRAKQESRQRRQMERASADSPRMHAAPRLKGHEQEAAASQLQNEHHAIGVAADDVRAAADMIVRRIRRESG